MKKIYKSLMLLTGTGLLTLGLASCGNSKRNTTTPTGSLDMTAAVATATNDQVSGGTFTLNTKTYYNRLRYSGYTSVTNAVKKAIYAKEYDAVLDVLKNETLAGTSAETQELLTLSKDGTALYSLSDNDLDYSKRYSNNYEYIRNLMLESLNKSLANAVFSSSSYEKISEYTDDELETYYEKYVDSRARVGITITKEDLAWTKPSTETDDLISFDKLTTTLLEKGILDSYLITLTENLAAKNALYQIADEEYIWEYDADKTDEDAKTKNDNYLFKESSLESSYESTYMTYGTYHAIVIQFNSRRDALNTINSLGLDFTDESTALENYVKLYNACYNYDTPAADATDERFYYNVSLLEDELSDLSDDIQTLITDTLEDGEYLSEPRNLSDKYVMVYNIDTTYEIGNKTEETEYDDLTDEEKESFDKMMKYNLIEGNASSYASTVYNSIIYGVNEEDEDDDTYLKIFDPLFDYKYSNSNSTIYENTTQKEYQKLNADGTLIFQYKDADGNTVNYTVEDFYSDATKAYGNTIITDYFQNEYAVQFLDDYIDDDTQEDNEDTLDDAIKEFKKGDNESYPKSVGLETYLLSSYGYDNRDDVLKYYFNAASCLTSYKADKVFKAWATLNSEKTATEGTNAYDISDTAKNGFLTYIMKAGNDTYGDLFNINLDHILINIDADADGSPDDPEDFLKDRDDAFRTKFETAVVELARAIYTEAMSGKYGDNSYYEILTYIATQYEEGNALLSDEYAGKTWDDFKDFSFLLTVEQLSSSSDITQDTVSNFVEPFKEYVENVYDQISSQDVDMDDYDNGLFYVYDSTDETGKALTTAADASNITIDSLCSTEYGYHLLIVNDYSGPDSTEFDASDDPNDYQGNLKILLYEDEDDDDNNIVVYTDSYNEDSEAASFNQFFIYYVQKANGASSSLDSDIATLMSTLFDDAYSTYTSSNFQTYLLLQKLDIQIVDSKASVFQDINLPYYHKLVTSYGEDDQYECWFDADHDWTRPEDPE